LEAELQALRAAAGRDISSCDGSRSGGSSVSCRTDHDDDLSDKVAVVYGMGERVVQLKRQVADQRVVISELRLQLQLQDSVGSALSVKRQSDEAWRAVTDRRVNSVGSHQDCGQKSVSSVSHSRTSTQAARGSEESTLTVSSGNETLSLIVAEERGWKGEVGEGFLAEDEVRQIEEENKSLELQVHALKELLVCVVLEAKRLEKKKEKGDGGGDGGGQVGC